MTDITKALLELDFICIDVDKKDTYIYKMLSEMQLFLDKVITVERELKRLQKKEVAMKVLNVEHNEYGVYGDCPTCKESQPISNYCQDCGQKLDWSDEK